MACGEPSQPTKKLTLFTFACCVTSTLPFCAEAFTSILQRRELCATRILKMRNRPLILERTSSVESKMSSNAVTSENCEQQVFLQRSKHTSGVIEKIGRALPQANSHHFHWRLKFCVLTAIRCSQQRLPADAATSLLTPQRLDSLPAGTISC